VGPRCHQLQADGTNYVTSLQAHNCTHPPTQLLGCMQSFGFVSSSVLLFLQVMLSEPS